MILHCTILGALLLGGIQGFFLKSKVCYDQLGCFSKDNGFDNTLDELPESPSHIQLTLTLFTPNDPHKGHLLDYKNEKSITESSWNPKKKTRIVIHGYLSDGGQPWVTNSTKYFLQMDNSNVIAASWPTGAHKFYPKAAANTRVVGAIIAKVLETARDKLQVKMADVHLIGHSLGAHISGYVGSRVEGIGRITGLDPAGPLFDGTAAAVHLDPTDAIYVDNIHTDGLPIYDAGFGTMSAWGHIDFYPNGAGNQPGCPPPIKDSLLDLVTFKFSTVSDTVSCAHQRAHDFFVASLADPTCNFKSFPCTSYADYQKGECNSCGDAPCPQMGLFSDKVERRGKFYLTTSAHFPYCSSG